MHENSHLKTFQNHIEKVSRMIRIGPAGIPLSCKGRTIQDGLKDVHYLGLSAMELQMVRPIMENDPEYYEQIGRLAKELDIELAIHLPYHTSLISSDSYVERNLEMMKFFGHICDAMGATTLVTHLGPYNGYTPGQAMEVAVENLRATRNYFTSERLRTRIGIENAGRPMLMGSLEEILQICEEVRFVRPVINFAHLHARGDGFLMKKDDFREVFELVEDQLSLNNFYAHFSGVEYKKGDESHYLPVKRGNSKFDQLANCILENNFNCTLISDSPLLEHDAMYMKIVFERILKRKLEKEQRLRQRQEAEQLQQAKKEGRINPEGNKETSINPEGDKETQINPEGDKKTPINPEGNKETPINPEGNSD